MSEIIKSQYKKLTIMPNYCGVDEFDTSTEILGINIKLPILVKSNTVIDSFYRAGCVAVADNTNYESLGTVNNIDNLSTNSAFGVNFFVKRNIDITNNVINILNKYKNSFVVLISDNADSLHMHTAIKKLVSNNVDMNRVMVGYVYDGFAAERLIDIGVKVLCVNDSNKYVDIPAINSIIDISDTCKGKAKIVARSNSNDDVVKLLIAGAHAVMVEKIDTFFQIGILDENILSGMEYTGSKNLSELRDSILIEIT